MVTDNYGVSDSDRKRVTSRRPKTRERNTVPVGVSLQGAKRVDIPSGVTERWHFSVVRRGGEIVRVVFFPPSD